MKAWSAGVTALGVLVGVCQAQTTNTWTGSLGMDWFADGNWSFGHYPRAGENVLVPDVVNSVWLTNTTARLGSFTIRSETLTFTNWTTALQATNVTIKSGGILTLPDGFATNGMSNCVHVICSNFTVEAGGSVNADAKGYRDGQGPGTGPMFYQSGVGGYGGGAGHGGPGGAMGNWSFALGKTYGSATNPVVPGSGGGRQEDPVNQPGAYGGRGGGAVRIEASGTVTVKGTISANGGPSKGAYNNSGGGGSGGSISVSCRVFQGSATGLIRANGGRCATTAGGDVNYGGGGGGGRIAISYASVGTRGVRFGAGGGRGWADKDWENLWQYASGWGTLCLPDRSLLSTTFVANVFSNVNLMFSGAVTSWGPASLTVSNASFGLPAGFRLTVTNALRIERGSITLLTNSTLTCGSMALTNGGSFTVYSGKTNGAATGYGGLVDVGGRLSVGPSSWIYPYAHETDGGGVLFRVGSLDIAANGGVNANAKGFADNKGYGKGSWYYRSGVGGWGSGGGYGGKGGGGVREGGVILQGGATYGTTNAPTLPGSGGARRVAAARGGGLVRIEAKDAVRMNGTITANGASCYGASNDGGGGGSGGGIFLAGRTVEGSGLLSAKGGNRTTGNASGGGGGGRVAVWYGMDEALRDRFLAGYWLNHLVVGSSCPGCYLNTTVTNGASYFADPDVNRAYPGTVVFVTHDFLAGTAIQVR